MSTASAPALETRDVIRVRRRVAVPPKRVAAIDQLRAIAILSMLVTHFGPGFLERIDAGAVVETVLLLVGRFATPAFVASFGITVGLVYRHKLAAGGQAGLEAARRMRRRSAVVLACALLVAHAKLVEQIASGPHGVAAVVLAVYSVLVFYGAAMLLMPALLGSWIGRSTGRVLGAGAFLWGAGALLAGVWPAGTPSGMMEVTRFYLVSGPYPVVQLLGCSLLCVPIGSAMRNAMTGGRVPGMAPRLLLLGVALMGAGLALGAAAGELDVARIIAGELKVPARLWYFGMFGGAAVALLGGLVWINSFALLGGLLKPVTIMGQCALLIYTAESFVFTLSDLLHERLGLRDPLGPWLAMLAFFAFVAVVVGLRWRRPHPGSVAPAGSGRWRPRPVRLAAPAPVRSSDERERTMAEAR